jgi:hypothetical protein
MWIDTKIKGTFETKNGGTMVSFMAKRGDGKNWAAPLWLVEKGLGHSVQTGLEVRIEANGDRVARVQRMESKPFGGKPDHVPSAPPSGGPIPGKAAKPATTSRLLPYAFVPVEADLAVTDTPVWHDGSSDGGGAGELWSGEILCSLEALTPLLPGNARYPLRKEGQRDGAAQVDLAKLRAWGFAGLKPGKQVAEPLRLADGRVVVAGSALKGMFRQSLGALLSAPMERVAERRFTYRPNLDFNKFDVAERYVVRPALVVAKSGRGWQIEVFDDALAAVFVRNDAEPLIHAAAREGVIAGMIPGICLDMDKGKRRVLKRHGETARLDGYRVAAYRGGIDGAGWLAKAFNQRESCTYNLALVPRESACTLEIPAELYQRYLEDQESVLANSESGHLCAHPLDINAERVSQSIINSREFSPGQLVYVEVATDSNGKVTQNAKVVSCGGSVLDLDIKPRIQIQIC